MTAKGFMPLVMESGLEETRIHRNKQRDRQVKKDRKENLFSNRHGQRKANGLERFCLPLVSDCKGVEKCRVKSVHEATADKEE